MIIKILYLYILWKFLDEDFVNNKDEFWQIIFLRIL